MEGLIISGTGLLGSYLVKYSNFDFTYRTGNYETKRAHKVDLKELEKVRSFILDNKPKKVVLSAALTDVDYCEEHPEEAFKINYEAPSVIAEAVKTYNGYLLFVSTDYVFDGQKGLYSEEDTRNPINIYGKSKELAEKHIESLDIRHAIVRTSAIFGGNTQKKNFVLWVYKNLKNGVEINVVNQIISPTLSSYLAKAVLEIAEREIEGKIHVAGKEPLSRVEIARRVKERFNLKGSFKVVETIQQWKAKRPKNSSLSVAKAENLLKNKPLSFEESLNELVKEVNLDEL
jgi:dTDP-4-dehydrorhamnose reductase